MPQRPLARDETVGVTANADGQEISPVTWDRAVGRARQYAGGAHRMLWSAGAMR
jgi:hypothetical protein